MLCIHEYINELIDTCLCGLLWGGGRYTNKNNTQTLPSVCGLYLSCVVVMGGLYTTLCNTAVIPCTFLLYNPIRSNK